MRKLYVLLFVSLCAWTGNAAACSNYAPPPENPPSPYYLSCYPTEIRCEIKEPTVTTGNVGAWIPALTQTEDCCNCGPDTAVPCDGPTTLEYQISSGRSVSLILGLDAEEVVTNGRKAGVFLILGGRMK